MKSYLKLLRVKHYIKNGFIFVPLIFSMNYTNLNLWVNTIYAFILFSIMASIIYVINDIVDVEKDRQHATKKNRPLASKKISITSAKILVCVLIVIFTLISILVKNNAVVFITLAYFIMNLAYSFKLKNIVIIDVFIISMGFLLRVFAGAAAIDVVVSEWLLLTTFAISLFLGFGKRYGEKKRMKSKTSRQVLMDYSLESLKCFMQVSLTLTIVFYSLYAAIGHSSINNVVFTVPIVVIAIFRYYMLLESDIIDGDPTEVILNDIVLQLIVLSYVILVGFLIVV